MENPEPELELEPEEEDTAPTCVLCEDPIMPNEESLPYNEGLIHYWCFRNKEAYEIMGNPEEIDEYRNRRTRLQSTSRSKVLSESGMAKEEVKARRVSTTRVRKYKTDSAPGAPTGVGIARKPGGLQRYVYPEGVVTRAEQRAYRRKMEAEGRLEEIRIAPPRPDFGIRRDGTSKAVPPSTPHVEDLGKPKGGNPTKVLSRRKKMRTVQTFDQSNKPLSIEEATEYLKNWDRDHYSGPIEEPVIEPPPGIVTSIKKWWNKIHGL